MHDSPAASIAATTTSRSVASAGSMRSATRIISLRLSRRTSPAATIELVCDNSERLPGCSFTIAANGPMTTERNVPPSLSRNRAMCPNRSAFCNASPDGRNAQKYISASHLLKCHEPLDNTLALVHSMTIDFDPRVGVERQRIDAEFQFCIHTTPTQQNEQC